LVCRAPLAPLLPPVRVRIAGPRCRRASEPLDYHRKDATAVTFITHLAFSAMLLLALLASLWGHMRQPE
jgi:hypothetical protein